MRPYGTLTRLRGRGRHDAEVANRNPSMTANDDEVDVRPCPTFARLESSRPMVTSVCTAMRSRLRLGHGLRTSLTDGGLSALLVQRSAA
jgi:hypothetical protein